jgi:hypothetical protein
MPLHLSINLYSLIATLFIESRRCLTDKFCASEIKLHTFADISVLIYVIHSV